MVNSMHINLDHDVLRKKTESRRLDIQVRWFLRKQKKQCPDQLPAGYSALNDKPKDTGWNNSQNTMRQAMTASVSSHRPVLEHHQKPLSTEQQRCKFNFEAKHEALRLGKDLFIGKCQKHGETEFRVYKSSHKHYCIACRRIIQDKRKELAA